MKTYFVDPGSRKGSSMSGSSVSGDSTGTASSPFNKPVPEMSNLLQSKESNMFAMKEARLVNWIVDLLHEHVKKLVAMRKSGTRRECVQYTSTNGQTSLDEVAEVIRLPRFDEKSFQAAEGSNKVTILPVVVQQLSDYVTAIASMYHNDNSFHNFGKFKADHYWWCSPMPSNTSHVFYCAL